MPREKVINGETWVLDEKSGKWHKKIRAGLRGMKRRVSAEFSTLSPEEKALREAIKHKKKVSGKFKY